MPVSRAEIDDRIERIRQGIAERKLDALVVYSAPLCLVYASRTSGNVHYLTGWALKNSPTVIVLPLTGEPVLIVPSPLHRKRAELGRVWIQDIRQHLNLPVDGGAVLSVVKEKVKAKGRVGLAGHEEMTAGLYNGLTEPGSGYEFVSADDILARLQLVKSKDELESMQGACKIADAMLFAGMNGARADHKWANELMALIENEGHSLGAEFAWCWISTGTAPDFHRGQQSETRRQIEDGDRVQIGTYVYYDGYWSEQIHIGVKGKPSSKLREYYDRLLEVQSAGLEALRPGKSLADVYTAITKALAKASPYAETEDPFRFRPGHTIGLHDGDPPGLNPFPQPATWQSTVKGHVAPLRDADVTIEPRMTFLLHPNFSVPDMGYIAIGEIVVVTKESPEILTKFPRGIYEI